MADTQPLAPTDAEIIALADATRTAEGGANGYILPISFARAVLTSGAAALGGFGSLHHCAPGGWRLSSMSRI